MKKQKILAALLALVMVVTLLPLTALAAGTETGTVTTYQPIKSLDELTDDGVYLITYETGTYGYMMHHPSGGTTNVFSVSGGTSTVLSNTLYINGNTQYTIKHSNNGYTIQSNIDDYYIVISGETEMGTSTNQGVQFAASTPQVLTIAPSGDGFTISAEVEGVSYYVRNDGVSTSKFFYVSTDPCDLTIWKQVEVKMTDTAKPDEVDKAGPHKSTTMSTTQDQPFPTGAGGSANFRIPGITVLEAKEGHDGWVAAVADARWSTTEDGGGLDTIFAISKDYGANWTNQFPIWFPDSNGYAGTSATTVIDPIMVQDNDGNIHIMADVNPTGITTAYTWPNTGTGYAADNSGKMRLALTDNYSNANTNPTTDTAHSSYPYYVGDFEDDEELGCPIAPVLKFADDQETDWYVDDCYNIYIKDDDGSWLALTQKQVNNTSTSVQQNCFYAGSTLHVYNTGYLWIASTSDYGETWTQQIINADVKNDNEQFVGVTPGEGLITSDGTILFAVYSNTQEGGHAPAAGWPTTIIYSQDSGKTWHRGPSTNATQGENEMVQLPDGTVRLFVRNGNNKVCYYDLDPTTETWGALQRTSTSCTGSCSPAAVFYPRTIGGKNVVLVSYPDNNGDRSKGRIFVFELGDNNSMTLVNTYHVNETFYAYSSLDVFDDGTVTLISEPDSYGIVKYQRLNITEIYPNAVVDPTLADLPDELVEIECDNEYHSGDKSAIYGVKDIADENKGVTIGEVEENEGVYTVTVTVAANLYVNKFTEEHDGTAHNLVNNDAQTATITMTYDMDEGKWTTDGTPVTFTVRCDAEEPVTPPTPPVVDTPVVTPPAGGDTELPEDQTPMNPTPDDGADVPDDSTPLAPAPEDKGDTDIEDEDTPLDSTPKTGDASLSIAILWSIFSLSAIGFVTVMLSMKKAGKHTK